MTRALLLRNWATWLFFGGATIAALVSASYIPGIMRAFGPAYPSTVISDLPAFTAAFLSVKNLIAPAMYLIVACGIMGAVLTFAFASSRENQMHSLSLVTLMMYHLVVMAWVGFALAYFWLPRIKAGI
jgi:hypothetical protein